MCDLGFEAPVEIFGSKFWSGSFSEILRKRKKKEDSYL